MTRAALRFGPFGPRRHSASMASWTSRSTRTRLPSRTSFRTSPMKARPQPSVPRHGSASTTRTCMCRPGFGTPPPRALGSRTRCAGTHRRSRRMTSSASFWTPTTTVETVLASSSTRWAVSPTSRSRTKTTSTTIGIPSRRSGPVASMADGPSKWRSPSGRCGIAPGGTRSGGSRCGATSFERTSGVTLRTFPCPWSGTELKQRFASRCTRLSSESSRRRPVRTWRSSPMRFPASRRI